MSLTSVIAAHNDAALKGLTSKGLLRRAHRDFDSGRGSIVAADKKTAEVLADGQTVNIDSRGPTAATCTCPAAGICRHVLLAVLLLRGAGEEEDVATGPTATEELCSLSEAQLRKFAGADWDKATALIVGGESAELLQEGQSLVVLLPELDASITFIAGQGLRQVAYKGPKTRQRLLTTVAAFLVRNQEGVTVSEELVVSSKPRPQVSQQFLDDARLVVQRAVAAVLPGRSEIAHDLLLDLAISTRVEALPRLSAELRGLAKLAKLAHSRDVSFEADAFLKGAARASALLEALRTNAGDLGLTGTIKRDYQARSDLTIWLLGVARWRSLAGARGATGYAYSPGEDSWFTVSDGRAAGMDPGYDPSSVYRASLWGGSSMEELIGKTVALVAPAAAADGSLSARTPGKTAKAVARVTTKSLLNSAIAQHEWSELHNDLTERLGRGLRRSAIPIPALIVPKSFRGFDFNDLEQVYEWEALDSSGDTITLSIPGGDHETARQLKQHGRRIRALLVEVSLGPRGLLFRPVTAVFDRRSSVELVNVDFDRWPHSPGLKAIERLSDLLGGSRKPAAAAIDPLMSIVTDVLDVLISKLGRSPSVDMDQVHLRAEAAGLMSLAAALKKIQLDPSVESALKAAYIASEVETSLLFQR